MAYLTTQEASTLVAESRPDLVPVLTSLLPSHLEFASDALDQYDWAGARTEGTQANAWPRVAVPIDRYDISLGYRASDAIPSEILLACALLAIRFATTPGIVGDSSNTLDLGSLVLQGTQYDLLGDHISFKIRPFLKRSGRAVYVNN